MAQQQADRILLEIQAEVGGSQNITRLTNLINHLEAELNDVSRATAEQRSQMVMAESELRRLAAGYAAGSSEAIRLTQAARNLAQQISRIDD